MIRLTLLAALVLAGCHPTSAEIRCGKTLCGSNQRCEPKQLICVLDEAPQLTIEEPRSGTLISGDTLTLSGSVRDDNGAAALELSLDEGKTWVQVPTSSDRFSARVALPSMDYQPLGLTLRALDSLQQATRARVGITIDNLAPVVTVGSPIEGSKLNVAWFAASPKVSGLAADGSGFASFSVDVGEGDVAVTPIGNQFSLGWMPRAGEDGVAREVKVTAVDLAGNRTVVIRKVTVDVVPPRVAWTVPAHDALLGLAFFDGGGLLHGSVSAGAKVTADLGNGPQAATVTKGRWSVAYTPPPSLDFQQQLLEVIAEDEAGNLARVVRMTTVDLVAPVLKFTSPVQGARLNVASFPSGDDVPVGWTATDGDPEVTVRNGASAVVAGALKVTTSATDNPRTYGLTLTAQDRAGNSSQAQLAFEVDRLRPTVAARIPSVDVRNASTTVAIDFSEDVSGADGVTLTPAAPAGAWTTPRHFEVSGLPADAVFSASVGAVVDAFGNPVSTSGPVKFHTAPMRPASGTTLMTDVVRFKAAADADGVLTVFTTSPTVPATFRWARVNPKTGVMEDNRPAWLPVVGGDFKELDAFAEARVNADLSAHRISAATTMLQWNITERRSWVREAAGIATTEIGMVGVVPMRAFPGEGVGLADVGFLKLFAGAVSYTRVGRADLAVGMGPPTAMGFAVDHWEMIEVRNQVFKHRTYGCWSTLANVPPTCELSALGQWTDVAVNDAASYAIADGCSVYVYNSTSLKRVVRIEPHAPTCQGRDCPKSSSAETSPLNELRVASDRRQGNSFIGAMRVAGGNVQLLRLPLDASCQGAFVNVAGGAVAVPAGATFEPVSLGGKPALLYVDASNELKVFVP